MDVGSSMEINTSLGALFSSMVIYNTYDVLAEAVVSPLQNINHAGHSHEQTHDCALWYQGVATA